MCNLHRQLLHKCQRRTFLITREVAIMEVAIILTIDEIEVDLAVNTITGAWKVLENALDQDNSARNYLTIRDDQIISSDIDRLLEIIIKGVNQIIEMIIVGIVRIEASHPEPHSCRTDTILYEEATRIELPQRVVIEFRCHGAQLLFMLTRQA